MITGKMWKLRCSHEQCIVSQIIYSRYVNILKFFQNLVFLVQSVNAILVSAICHP